MGSRSERDQDGRAGKRIAGPSLQIQRRAMGRGVEIQGLPDHNEHREIG